MGFKKSKRLALVLMAILIFTLLPSNVFAVNQNYNLANLKKVNQKNNYNRITSNSGGKSVFNWDKKQDIPSFVSGKLSNQKVNSKEDAFKVMSENRDLFLMNSAIDELSLYKQFKDKQNTGTYKFQQTYKGVPVFGNQLILHNDKNGNVTTINGHFDPKVKTKGVKTSPAITSHKAIDLAKNSEGLAKNTKFNISKAKLYIFNKDNSYYLAYQVTLSAQAAKGPVYEDIFIDAVKGTVIQKINRLDSSNAIGSGLGVHNDSKSINTEKNDIIPNTYYLRDNTKGATIVTYTANYQTTNPPTLETDADNIWNDPAAVDAHYNAGQVYNYYYTKFGRNSYNNLGGSIISVVHYGTNYNNAYWDGTEMIYGDGDGVTVNYPFAGALDVVGHELTHAVIDNEVNLYYENQSGALNESFADVFGNLIENKPDNNWLLGEDLYSTPGTATRSMSNPTLYSQPDNMSGYVTLPNDSAHDYGGVHINSGIPNKAFYNFVTSPGITRDMAANIYYRAMTQYLTSTSNFGDARYYLIQSATDLYGANSTVVSAMKSAWQNVGFPIDNYEPNNSRTEAYPINSSVAYQGIIESAYDNDWFKFSTNTTGTINISLTNLPADYDIKLYDSNGIFLQGSFNTSTTSESISYANAPAGTYYILVYGYYDFNPLSTYTLSASYTYLNSATTGIWNFKNNSTSVSPSLFWESTINGFSWTSSKEATGDFNGDGFDDVAILYDYGNGSSGIWFFMSDGTKYTPMLAWQSGPGGFSWQNCKLTSGDYNGDGKDDLAVLYDYGSGSSGLWTFISNGTTVTPHLSWMSDPGGFPSYNSKITSGDFNGDGKADVGVLYNYGAGMTGIWTFKSDGMSAPKFTPQQSWLSTPGGFSWNNSKITSGDYDGDGKADLGVLYDYGGGMSGIWNFKSNGTTMNPYLFWISAPGGFSWSNSKLVSGKFNGDNKSDIGVLFNYGSNSSGLWNFTSNGTSFAPSLMWMSGVGNFSWDRSKLLAGNSDKVGYDDYQVIFNYADN